MNSRELYYRKSTPGTRLTSPKPIYLIAVVAIVLIAILIYNI